MPTTHERRRALRLEMRTRRAELSPDDQAAAAMAVTVRLMKLRAVRSARLIAGYRAVRGELNIDASMAFLAEAGADITVPRVAGEYLEFISWDMDGVTIEGSFGIPEPVEGSPRPLIAHDVVLAPLVAFDSVGNRLGQGGGFYDRALAGRSGRAPVVIGVGHGFQHVDSLPTETWDVAVDAVVTDEAVFEFKPGCLGGPD